MKQMIGLLRGCRPHKGRNLSMKSFVCVVALLMLSASFTVDAETVDISENYTELSNSVPIESAIESLSSDSLSSRIKAIQQLGALKNDMVKNVLMNHFDQLPRARPTTGSSQTEKIIVAEALLAQMDRTDQHSFMLRILDDEIAAIREAKQIERDVYYPKDLLRFILARLEREGMASSIPDRFKKYVHDSTLPHELRSEALSIVISEDMSRKDFRDDTSRVKYLLSHIESQPTAPIPWVIYTNTAKRIEYGNSEDYKNALETSGQWLRSDVAMTNAAYELLLYRYGLTGASTLIDALDNENFDLDRKDSFALLASSILKRVTEQTQTIVDVEKEKLDRLRQYVTEMKDEGAFSKRARTAANLNAVYRAIGVDQAIPVMPSDTVVTR